MGTTTKGFPWPEPTDAVADTDLAIKALAQDVDTHVGRHARGTQAVVVSAGAVGTVVGPTAVALPAGRFPTGTVPVPVANAENGNVSGVFCARNTNLSWNLYIRATAAATYQINWHASL